jgi:hypothetical protein
VQQVGRIVRNPTLKPDQHAYVFAERQYRQSAYWESYLQYERNFEENPNRYDALQRFQTAVQLQPEFEYFDRNYRQRFNINAPNLHKELRFSLSANVYLIPNSGFKPDDLEKELRDEWKAEDLDIVKSEHPDKSAWIHIYVNYSNSPLLLESALVEYKLGFSFYKVSGNYLFFYDSEGNTCEYLRSKAKRVPPAVLRKLFTGADARLSQVSLLNTDLGRNSIRRRTVHAYSLGTTAPGLADHAHFCSTAHGYSSSNGGFASRYVGFSRGRISDRSVSQLGYQEYVEWLEQLRKELENESQLPAEVFERFAEFVEPPEDPTPRNILLDLDEAKAAYKQRDSNVPLETEDLCVEVESGDDGRSGFQWCVNSVPYRVHIVYDAERFLYDLRCSELERAYVRNDGKSVNLITHLNRTQSFRVVPVTPGVIYAHSQFYAPRLPIGARAVGRRLELLQILQPLQSLLPISSEKGESQESGNGWVKGSIFHLIDTFGARTDWSSYFNNIDLLVCDDAGANEIADFVAADTANRKVLFIHAKAQSGKGSVRSASAFAEVCSQAVKNLQYLIPFNTEIPPNLNLWNGPWKTPSGLVDKRIRKGRGKAAGLWKQIQGIVRDPSSTREVWIVLANSFSLEAFESERKKNKSAPEIVQILYSLQSTWAAVGSIGARLRIFCSP